MSRISVRLDDKRAKSLSELYQLLGVTGECDADNFRDFVDRLQSKLVLAKDSQAIGKALGEHQNKPVDTTCNLRVQVKETVYHKVGTEIVDRLYCLQFKEGVLKRQLKLVAPIVCEVCRLIREQLLEETQNDQPTEAPITVPTTPANQFSMYKGTTQPKHYDTRYCPDSTCHVPLVKCDRCKTDNSIKWYACESRRLEAHEPPLKR